VHVASVAADTGAEGIQGSTFPMAFAAAYEDASGSTGHSIQALNRGRQNESVCPARVRPKSDAVPARAKAA
jgi:hypothetical protein